MNVQKNILFITFTRADWHNNLKSIFDEYGYALNTLCLTDMENISKSNILNYIEEIHTKFIVFDLEFSSVLDQNFLARIKEKLDLKYVFNFCDDNTQKKINQKFIPICDLALVTSSTSLNYYKNNGVDAAMLFYEVALQEGEIYYPPNYNGKGLKLAFYGSLEKGRREYLRDLKGNGLNVTILPFIKDQIALRNEISKYDVIINFSKSHKRIPYRFFNTLLYKHFLRKFLKHPERDVHLNEFKGRVTECMMFKRLCFCEHFDEYDDFFPNKELPVFKNSEELLQLVKENTPKETYYETLDQFLSIFNKDSNSFHYKFVNGFRGKLQNVYDKKKGNHGDLNFDFIASLYSMVDIFIIRSYFVLSKYLKFLKRN